MNRRADSRVTSRLRFDCFDRLEQGGQRRQIPLADRRQIPLVQGADRGVDGSNELQSRHGDLRAYYSAVGALARPADQAAQLEAVEQPGDVGIAGDETVGNFATGETVRRGMPEGVERTVLGERELERREGRADALAEPFSEPQDAQE